VANPEYELIALHPEHFLPGGAVLTVYSPANGSPKNYVAAGDRCLRESPDPNSPRLPPFRHTDDREFAERLNIFLVILNAEIKFWRYFEMIREDPPPIPLPDDVTNLMRISSTGKPYQPRARKGRRSWLVCKLGGEEIVEEPPELIPRCSLSETLVRMLRWKTLKMTMFRISAPLNLSK
jgi:hypothetical protein